MSNPTVACVMLANGRPEMVKRAVKSFRAQMYENKRLLILDTGKESIYPFVHSIWREEPIGKMVHVHGRRDGLSIGALRNDANEHVPNANIIVHWDSDDWSHPNRIAEQVALLESSGAECVGYNEMLFWETHFPFPGGPPMAFDEGDEAAWLYRAAVPNYAVGTSMCYWREAWERNPFANRSEGCDDLDWFNRGVKIASVDAFMEEAPDRIAWKVPRMIASIHGGNTCSKIDASKREWARVPIWDAYCREAMNL